MDIWNPPTMALTMLHVSESSMSLDLCCFSLASRSKKKTITPTTLKHFTHFDSVFYDQSEKEWEECLGTRKKTHVGSPRFCQTFAPQIS